jgi:Protein of unknown function (DUF3604)
MVQDKNQNKVICDAANVIENGISRRDFLNASAAIAGSIPLASGVFTSKLPAAENKDMQYMLVSEKARNDSPSIIFDEDGVLWVAWCAFENGHYRLSIRKKEDGKWSDVQTPDDSVGDQVEPQWAIGGNRSPVLVYTVYNKPNWTVRVIERRGKGWTKPQELGVGSRPVAAVVAGQVWVVWEQDGCLAVLNPRRDGLTLKPTGSFSSYNHPCLATGPKDEVWMAWDASQAGYQSVKLQRVDLKNQEILTVDDGSGVNREPKISIDGKGLVWIVYESMHMDLDLSRRNMKSVGAPVYLFERGHKVAKPSTLLRVTDGRNWWATDKPETPAYGLAPSLLCSKDGPVWLLSRRYDRFYPLCEELDSGGWKNHRYAWGELRSYKVPMALAEAPDGQVWTAWAHQYRERTGMRKAPCWSVLDGNDAIIIAPMPKPAQGGAPTLHAMKREAVEPPAPIDFPSYQAKYKGENLNVYFGDLHVHSEYSTCGRWNGALDQNHLYSNLIRGLDFFCTSDHAEHLNDHNWRHMQLVAQKYNKPGSFATYTGFEWTSEFDKGGNLNRGHYNVVFRSVDDGDYYYSSSDTRYNTPMELWKAIRGSVGPQNALTFAHHTSRRMAWLTWNYYDPEMAPLIEIAQSRGSYEYDGCFDGLVKENDCSRVRGHFIQDGLNRGMRHGFVASGDHGGRTLTAVFAPKLDRDTIFENLQAKRTFATNGERMFVDFRLNGHFMGDAFQLQSPRRKIEISATGTDYITQIEVFRNGRVINQWNLYHKSRKVRFTDKEPLYQRENYYYVRVTQKDGGLAWSSPIWVTDPRIPGDFHFQIGGDELHVVYPDQESDFSILMHNQTDEKVQGKVHLDVPDGWKIREGKSMAVECAPGEWKHAIFNVTASSSGVTQLCMPTVKARFEYPNGKQLQSELFVVGSPVFVSRAQKAQLVDAKTDVPLDKFENFIRRIEKIWSDSA